MNVEKVNSLKDKGNKAYVDGKYDEALDFYKEALDSIGSGDTNIAAILHSNISQTYLKKKEYSYAIESATESLKLDPSFMKSNLRRATASIELENLADAMKDLRLIFSSDSNSKAAKELMHRCSDKPKMKRELHEVYAKHYLRQVLKKLGAQIVNRNSGIRSSLFKSALLRQSFLSMEGLDIANHFFCDTFVVFIGNQGVDIYFIGWVQRQLMWFKYTYTRIEIKASNKLFELLYGLLRSGTFTLAICFPTALESETLLTNKYLDVYLLVKEAESPVVPINEFDVKIMDRYSSDMTRLVYHPGLANLKNIKFSKAKVLTVNGTHSITNDFLKLWKKCEWPIESLSFVCGITDHQIFKKFNGAVSSEVSNVFIRLTETNHAFNEVTYSKLCNYLETLKSVFPGLINVTIRHEFHLNALYFPEVIQDMFFIRGAYETISAKPKWCSKLKVMIIVYFKANLPPDFKAFDVKLLGQAVESFRQKHPEMKLRLYGPRSYDDWWTRTPCAHAVIEFENKVAQFEVAFLGCIL